MVVSSFALLEVFKIYCFLAEVGFVAARKGQLDGWGKKGENGLRRIFPCIDKCFKESPLKVTKI